MTPVYIKWIDAMSADTQWKTIEDAIDWGADVDCTVEEIGFIVEENKEYILLASRINNNMVAGLMKIPKKYITKRTDICITN